MRNLTSRQRDPIARIAGCALINQVRMMIRTTTRQSKKKTAFPLTAWGAKSPVAAQLWQTTLVAVCSTAWDGFP
jgi:hypothetical protein